MPIYKNGSVEIYYEEAGRGFPLLVIPGGGLNARIPYLSTRTPFNPMDVLSDEYQCIAMDIRELSLNLGDGMPAQAAAVLVWLSSLATTSSPSANFTP